MKINIYILTHSSNNRGRVKVQKYLKAVKYKKDQVLKLREQPHVKHLTNCL